METLSIYMNIESRTPRQAVVVIHGMGEQRPMDTLRSFVDGIKTELERVDPAEKNSTVRSKPDSVGDIYETNRLSMDGLYTEDHKLKRPKTDFYEFYWAHNMRGTKFSHMTTWMNRLIFKKVRNVPPRLKSLWYTVWVLFIIAVATAIYFSQKSHLDWYKQLIAPLVTLAAFPTILSVVSAYAKTIFLNSAGDAARYFTPVPDNIAERSHIRQQGLQFLKKLHELQGIEQVDRIIVVAHSLGTVVAYDFLRLLWTEYNTIHAGLAKPDQERLAEIDQYYDENSPLPGTVAGKKFPTGIKLDDSLLNQFQDLQFACWQEQKTLGNPWLISDFITMGAAINAVDYFMVTNVGTPQLIEQRELPVSPPAKDKKDYSIFYRSPGYEVDGVKCKVNLLNHGALFAVTRWTNIFYKSDFVGGPIQRIFGRGVRDIELKRKSLWLYPGGHTDYWNKKDKNNAIKEIITAMRLNIPNP